MTRKDLQDLSRTRPREATRLLNARHYAGAYYLAGYCIELGLKACIAKRTRRHDFPEFGIVRDSYTHDLPKLVRTSGLEADFNRRMETDSVFASHWAHCERLDVKSKISYLYPG